MEEKMKWNENEIVSYGEHYKKGLMNREGEILLDNDSNKFSSLIPSRNNTPLLPIVATFNKNGGAIKGIIVIKQDGCYNEVPFDGSHYNYIDGFDGGLARVNQINEKGEKRWGIIGLSIVENELIVKEVIEPKYDDLWSFYDKERNHVPAILNGSTIDISLDNLRAELDNISGRIVSTLKPKTYNEYVSITSVSMQNFKRYKELTQIDLSSRITFVVGKNNSGKSTFLRALELCSDNLRKLPFTEDGDPYFCFDHNNYTNVDIQNELYSKYRSFNSLDSEPLLLTITTGEWEFMIQMNNSAFISRITASNIVNGNKAIFSKGRTELYYQNNAPYIYETENKWIVKRSFGDRGFDPFFKPILDANTDLNFNSQPSISNVLVKDIKALRDSLDIALTGFNGIEPVNVFAPVGKEKYKSCIFKMGNESFSQDTQFVGDSIIHYYDIVEIKDH